MAWKKMKKIKIKVVAFFNKKENSYLTINKLII